MSRRLYYEDFSAHDTSEDSTSENAIFKDRVVGYEDSPAYKAYCALDRPPKNCGPFRIINRSASISAGEVWCRMPGRGPEGLCAKRPYASREGLLLHWRGSLGHADVATTHFPEAQSDDDIIRFYIELMKDEEYEGKPEPSDRVAGGRESEIMETGEQHQGTEGALAGAEQLVQKNSEPDQEEFWMVKKRRSDQITSKPARGHPYPLSGQNGNLIGGDQQQVQAEPENAEHGKQILIAQKLRMIRFDQVVPTTSHSASQPGMNGASELPENVEQPVEDTRASGAAQPGMNAEHSQVASPKAKRRRTDQMATFTVEKRQLSQSSMDEASQSGDQQKHTYPGWIDVIDLTRDEGKSNLEPRVWQTKALTQEKSRATAPDPVVPEKRIQARTGVQLAADPGRFADSRALSTDGSALELGEDDLRAEYQGLRLNSQLLQNDKRLLQKNHQILQNQLRGYQIEQQLRAIQKRRAGAE